MLKTLDSEKGLVTDIRTVYENEDRQLVTLFTAYDVHYSSSLPQLEARFCERTIAALRNARTRSDHTTCSNIHGVRIRALLQ
jgi:hypothetical protein